MMDSSQEKQTAPAGKQMAELNQRLSQALDVAALALEQAEQADQAKSRFLAGFSHEIRTPLNSLLGLIDLLRQTELTPRQEQFMEMIDHTGQHLLGLLNQALSFAKLEQFSLELSETEFELPTLLSEIFTPYQLQWQQRGLAGHLQLDPALPATWHGDPHRLRQVLVNLLDNAGKFTPQGSITLAVAMEQRDGHPVVHCRVEDTGVGIPAAKVEKIFTPFAQADGSISGRYGGTGLGLTICRQLIELMGGEIWVTDGEQGGSSFHFVLPRRNRPEPEPTEPTGVRETIPAAAKAKATTTAPAPPPNPAAMAAAAADTDITGLRVLVVDDDLVGRTVTGEMLKGEGCRVSLAADGEEALARLAAEEFDLALLDIQMPRLDGPATAAAIRQGRWQGQLIAMTGETAEELGDRLADFDGYLQKPFNRRHLLDEISAARRARPAGFHRAGR